ncbi:MAG TPA: glycosyl hydrolase family 8 [Candidatus Saccharimonadales bacterium]|nr:glycosyl hydrolase family 8 [Candidatus Saccharimonadales bacterium]
MKKIVFPLTNFLKNNSTLLVLISLLIVSFVSHAFNMFHFPYYENDEGTYMSQAWSLLKFGQMQPYTYWYDHAPAGWIFIALWNVISGGFFTFGTSVNSGRVFMLLLHLASTFFLFKITKKISGKTLAAAIAVLFFALSPLEIYYGRRVLLDNIMLFWSLFSIFLLTNTSSKLRYAALSALTFGIAVLSKENAVFFVPAFLYLIYTKFHKHHKVFAFVEWISITGAIVSLYFIYALLREEFFPVGFMGNMTPHVSLLTTLHDQVSRGANLPFWNTGSDFYNSLTIWLGKDAFIIIAGAISSLITILLSWKIKAFRIPALLIGFFWLFLLRGKLVIDFYVIPLLPLLGMSMGMISELVVDKLTTKTKFLYIPIAILLVSGTGVYYYFHQTGQYTHDETTPQVNAINWIKNNLPANANIIIDDYMYVDLHDKRFAGDKVFPNANWAWKIEDDPAVTLSKTDTNWTQTIYIALSHEMVKQIKSNNFPFIKRALSNASLLVDWRGGYDFRDVSQFISTNGDWISMYKVRDRYSIMLESSWNYYKNNFIHSYGQVIDPQTDTTTSEGQSYAMLRAVGSNDKKTFDGVWAWTHDHMQYRTSDKLFSWQFVKKGNTYVESDSNTATDADEDIAAALLMAYDKWHDPKYLELARPIISDIWQTEVVQVNGAYYLTSGSKAETADGYILNPSYLSPAYYQLFAQVDKTHPWNQLTTDSYTLLNRLARNNNQLPPNWILITKGTGEIASAGQYVNDNFQNDYGYDAFRVFYRVALDAKWNNSKNAIAYLNRYKTFFDSMVKNNSFAAIYLTNGKKAVAYNSLSTTSGALSDLSITDPQAAAQLYNEQFDKYAHINEGYWNDGKNYYDQNWAWFATALYANTMTPPKNIFK